MVELHDAFTIAELNLKKIMEAKTPEENIQILPHDVISVPKAEMVYVIGEVHRSGGFVRRQGVEHDCQIGELLGEVNIGDVGDPELVNGGQL